MITDVRMMQPLPVRPVDGPVREGSAVPVRSTDTVMQPLPHPPAPEPTDLGSAIRDAAFQRMLDRRGAMEPQPIVDPRL